MSFPEASLVWCCVPFVLALHVSVHESIRVRLVISVFLRGVIIVPIKCAASFERRGRVLHRCWCQDVLDGLAWKLIFIFIGAVAHQKQEELPLIPGVLNWLAA